MLVYSIIWVNNFIRKGSGHIENDWTYKLIEAGERKQCIHGRGGGILRRIVEVGWRLGRLGGGWGKSGRTQIPCGGQGRTDAPGARTGITRETSPPTMSGRKYRTDAKGAWRHRAHAPGRRETQARPQWGNGLRGCCFLGGLVPQEGLILRMGCLEGLHLKMGFNRMGSFLGGVVS